LGDWPILGVEKLLDCTQAGADVGFERSLPSSLPGWYRALSTTKVVEAGLIPEHIRLPAQVNIRTFPLDQDARAAVVAVADVGPKDGDIGAIGVAG
jgi:hypothetical protein